VLNCLLYCVFRYDLCVRPDGHRKNVYNGRGSNCAWTPRNYPEFICSYFWCNRQGGRWCSVRTFFIFVSLCLDYLTLHAARSCWQL